MGEQEFVERVMALHWDMAACPCPVCVVGRRLRFSVRREYLRHVDSSSHPVVEALATHLGKMEGEGKFSTAAQAAKER